MRGALDPVSTRAETVAVFRAGAFVFLAALLLISLHATGSGRAGSNPAADLLPFQKLFADSDPGQQRVFRALQEGVLEAERVRGLSKNWPSVEALAREGIPPFGFDPIDKTGLRWTLVRDRLVINYRGASAAGEWLLLVQEPEPAAIDLSANATADETHHLLSDGTLLHVTIWVRSAKSEPARVIDRPFVEGWSQILAGPKTQEPRT